MSMPTLVLVHGSWHSPAHFEPMIKELQSKHEYKCVAVALPSTQTPDTPPANLSDDTKAIRDAVTAELDAGQNVVVVAHSYGGTPTNNALKGLDEKSRKANGFQTCVRGVAFLNAIIFPAGQAFIDQLGGKPQEIHDLHGDLAGVGPPGGEYYFYNEMPEADQKYWTSLLRQQNWLAYLEKTAYAAYLDYPCWYLSCANDQALVIAVQELILAGAKAERANIEVVRLEGVDHTPFIGKHMQTTINFIIKVVEATS